jgi:hypothetical protein
MRPDKAASTSSDETAISLPWTEAVVLGQEIVKQLGLDTTTDTLSRWMAHRVAELIAQGENDQTRRADAADLILRLWERRGAWPQGWPPPAMARVLQWLDPNQRTAEGSPSSPWSIRLGRVEEALRREFTVWMTLALLDDAEAKGADRDDDSELFDSMLDDHLLDSERNLASLLTGARRVGMARYFQRLGPESTSAERANVAREELIDLLRHRMDLFDEAFAELTDETDVTAVDPSDE